jgi:hypothetical protein
VFVLCGRRRQHGVRVVEHQPDVAQPPDDTSAEVFTTGNASTVENFAATNGIQLLAFWALGRDNQAAAVRRRAPTSSPTSSMRSPVAAARLRTGGGNQQWTIG